MVLIYSVLVVLVSLLGYAVSQDIQQLNPIVIPVSEESQDDSNIDRVPTFRMQPYEPSLERKRRQALEGDIYIYIFRLLFCDYNYFMPLTESYYFKNLIFYFPYLNDKNLIITRKNCKTDAFMFAANFHSLGFCVIHTVNSEKNASAFHPDASIDPRLPRMLAWINIKALRKAVHDKYYSKQKSWQLDAFLPDGERLIVDDGLKIKPQERYATMKPVDGDGDPRNPFDNERDDSKKTKSLLGGVDTFIFFVNSVVIAIRPVMVLHQGSPVSLPFMECKVGVPCISTVAFPDSSPCPARQGDPCAPKPPCVRIVIKPL
uniref:Secreted protein n=1 Tax=Heterorhabditis bacteriophora TaxID=37862 RepID=A0A1I7WIG7_HETBA